MWFEIILMSKIALGGYHMTPHETYPRRNKKTGSANANQTPSLPLHVHVGALRPYGVGVHCHNGGTVRCPSKVSWKEP